MGCDVRYLYFVYGIVAVNHVIKPMLPVHSHKRHSLVIIEQETAVAIYKFFLTATKSKT